MKQDEETDEREETDLEELEPEASWNAQEAQEGDLTGDEDPAELARQRDEFLGLWKRAQADYKNLRRRGLADLEAGIRRSLQPLLENMLLVLDHLDMALSSPTESEDAKNLAIGVKMTRDQFAAALEREDVQEIPTDGAFDPELHQAVAKVEDSGAEPGTIVETVRKGYRWRDVVLRHAHVRVAAEPASAEAPAEDAGAETSEG